MLFRILLRLCKKSLFPLGWTVLVVILLCLPGSAIPSQGPIFSLPNIDKIVHVVLFGGIVLFWGLFLLQQNQNLRHKSIWLILTALLTIALGVILEFVQLNYIPNRSFDLLDIGADAAGSLLFMGVLFVRKKGGKI